MGKLIFFASIAFLLITAAACSNNCDGHRISFRLLYGNKGEDFKIYVNGILKSEEKIEKEFYTQLPSTERRQFEICPDIDTLKVRFSTGSRDTTFEVVSKEVQDCYVGTTIKGDPVVIYNYVSGGFRELSPVR